MAKQPSQQELAQLLAARIVQLHSFSQVWNLVRSVRFGTQYVFPDEASIARAEALVTADLMAKLFSMFDRSGTDLRKLATADPDLADEIASIGAAWERIEKPLTRIRHNLSAHAAKTVAGTNNAIEAFKELGADGIETVFRLIERMFQLAPWLAAEAKHGPPSFDEETRMLFRQVLVARRELNALVYEARRAWADPGECARYLEQADVAVGVLQKRWTDLRSRLSQLQELSEFVELWERQVNGERLNLQSLRSLRDTLDRVGAVIPPATANGSDALRSLRTVASTLASSFRMWRSMSGSNGALNEVQLRMLESAESALASLVSVLEPPQQ